MIDVMFDHYLITRFNVVISGLAQYASFQRGTIVQTEDWLNRRFELFERYCFPCVKNQTCQEFRWLVLFNTDTPKKYLDKIEIYRTSFPNLIPIFVEPYEDEIAHVTKYIQKNRQLRRLSQLGWIMMIVLEKIISS